MELRSLASRLQRAGRSALHDCRVGWTRANRRLKAHVLIARDGPSGITLAVFLVDLGCLGVKECVVREGLSTAEYDHAVRTMEEDIRLEPCEPAYARKLVETAAGYASNLGFRPGGDFAAARGLFGDADPRTCTEEFRCGADGLPFYDPGPEDDMREVLRRLEERLGPQGFRYLLLPGDVEHEETFPGDDDPDPLERAWGRLRRAEGWVTKALLKTAALHFGRSFFERIRDEFALGQDPEDVEEAAAGVQESWALSRRIPGFRPKNRPPREEEERSAVEIVLEENGPRLPELERRLLETLLRRPFSFYVIRDVEPGRRMRLRDLFTGDEYDVRERSASTSVFEGAVLFARVVALDSVAILMGCGSYVIPPSFRYGLLELRDELALELGVLDEEKLLELDPDLRDEFCEIAERIRHPPSPRLQNTDGEPLILHRLEYELACSPRDALDALKGLAFEWDDEDFARESTFDESGALAGIAFPWLGRGNRAHPTWTNTVLGRIRIDGTKMEVEVNSNERSERIRREIEGRLGERARLRQTAKTTLEGFMSRAEAERLSAARDSDERGEVGGERARAEAAAASTDRPDLATLEREMAATHWRSWPDHPIPALGEASPREAARTECGRERLEVLLDDYAFHASRRDDPWKPDVAALRRELGL